MPTKAEVAAITQDERTRIEKIVNSPVGLAHPKTALHLALFVGMEPKAAIATMAALPQESAFLDAMDQQGAIGIKPGGSAGLLSGDAKTVRMEEIKAAGRAYNEGRGYRPRSS